MPKFTALGPKSKANEATESEPPSSGSGGPTLGDSSFATSTNEGDARRLVGHASSKEPPMPGIADVPTKTLRELGGGIAVRGAAPVSFVAPVAEQSELQPPLNIHPSEPNGPGEIMVATYNVENLFDSKDDVDHSDEEFTPGGRQAWTEAKIDRKVENLGRVLRSTNGGRGPEIVALVEVENRDVVTRLRDKGLGGLGYQSIAHVDGPDFRGIDNAIISKYPLVEPPKLHQIHEPNTELWGDRTTRGILEATYEVDGSKLTVFVNHWPSKRGGDRAEAQRVQAGQKLRALIDERRAEDPNREIVLLGDFNATFGEAPLGPRGLGATRDREALQEGEAVVFNTTPEGPRMGTHYYHPKDEWSTFDHILVSPTLLDDRGLAWVPGSTQVVREPFMLTGKGAPKRFYQPRVDPKDQGLEGTGFSDHLPVVARLQRQRTP